MIIKPLHMRLTSSRKKGNFANDLCHRKHLVSVLHGVETLFAHARPLCWGVMTEWVDGFFY